MTILHPHPSPKFVSGKGIFLSDRPPFPSTLPQKLFLAHPPNDSM